MQILSLAQAPQATENSEAEAQEELQPSHERLRVMLGVCTGRWMGFWLRGFDGN